MNTLHAPATTVTDDALYGHFSAFETVAFTAPDRAETLRNLEPLVRAVALHLAATERVLAQIEFSLGHNHQVASVQRLHRSLIAQIEALVRLLDDRAFEPTHDEFAGMLRNLRSTIHRHRQLETDLLLSAVDQDIGVGD